LLSESIGAGHERAAAAIEEVLREREVGLRITRLNLPGGLTVSEVLCTSRCRCRP
jgi:hypothetical protein